MKVNMNALVENLKMVKVIGDARTSWILISDTDVEPIGIAEKMSYLSALDCFAANWPEFMPLMDELRADFIDLVGGEPVTREVRHREKKQRGSGARFRELILAGKSNEECLQIVRAEFPDSKATLSDAAWNRYQLKKNPVGFSSNGSKIKV